MSDMEQLQAMGFDAASSSAALDISSGSLEGALEILLSGEAFPSPAGSGGIPLPSPPLESPVVLSTGQINNANIEEVGELSTLSLPFSQYSLGDQSAASACTAIATTTAIALLSSSGWQRNRQDQESLRSLLTTGFQEGVSLAATAQGMHHREHLSIDEIWQTLCTAPCASGGNPTSSVRVVDSHGMLTRQGLWTRDHLASVLLAELRHASASTGSGSCVSVAAVITKPPETVLLVYTPISSEWHVLDSHSRPHLGSQYGGAALSSSTSSSTVIDFLMTILPPFPSDPSDENDMMIQLTYNACEYMLLAPSSSDISVQDGAEPPVPPPVGTE